MEPLWSDIYAYKQGDRVVINQLWSDRTLTNKVIGWLWNQDSGQIYSLINKVIGWLCKRIYLTRVWSDIHNHAYKQGDRVVMESDSGQIYTLTNKVIGW